MKKYIIIFFLATILSHVAWAKDQVFTKTVEFMGEATVHNEDIASARNSAITSSLISAVEIVVADLLPIESRIQNFEALDKILYAHAEKFIQNYKVLIEAISEKNYKMIVQSTVSIDKIRRQLAIAKILIGNKPMPKILFFISEQKTNERLNWFEKNSNPLAFVAEDAMSEAMKEKGFLIIDRENIINKMQQENFNHKSKFGDNELINLGTRLNADIVIIGSFVSEIIPNIMENNVKSFRGSVEAHAFKTDTATQIASSMQSVAILHTDKFVGCRSAISEAGFFVGEELVSQILEVWREKAEKPMTLKIVVKNADSLANFVKFRKILNNMSEIKSVQTKEIKPHESIIIVVFQGDSKKLANALMLNSYESFGIHIQEILQNQLIIELIPNQ